MMVPFCLTMTSRLCSPMLRIQDPVTTLSSEQRPPEEFVRSCASTPGRM